MKRETRWNVSAEVKGTWCALGNTDMYSPSVTVINVSDAQVKLQTTECKREGNGISGPSF